MTDRTVPVMIHTLLANACLPAAAQRAAASAGLAHILVDNTSLDRDLWYELYPTGTGKGTANIKHALAWHRLDAARIDHVLDNKPTATTLSALLAANDLSTAQLERVIASKAFSASLADKHYMSEWAAKLPDGRRRLADKAGGVRLLQHMSDPDTPLDQVVATLATFAEWGPKIRATRKRTTFLANMYGAHPELIEATITPDSPVELLSAAAGSHHLVDETFQMIVAGLDPTTGAQVREDSDLVWVLLRLVWNPRTTLRVLDAVATAAASWDESSPMCSGGVGRRDKVIDAVSVARARTLKLGHVGTGPYSTVEDPQLVEMLVRRCCSSSFDDQFRPARPHELFELSSNPHLTDFQKEKMVGDLRGYDVADALGEARTEFAYTQLTGDHSDLDATSEPDGSENTVDPAHVAGPLHGPANTELAHVRRMLDSPVQQPSSWTHLVPEMLVRWIEILGFDEAKWRTLFDMCSTMDVTVEQLAYLANELTD